MHDGFNTKDPFVIMVGLLNSKIQELADQLDASRTLLDDARHERGRTEDLEHDLRSAKGEAEYYRKQFNQTCEDHEKLRVSNNALQMELYKYRANDPSIIDRAQAFMLKEGGSLMQQGQKIQCIKEIRTITSWGLKEAKDYVEAWKAPSIGDIIREKLGVSGAS
jgi:hypothetical protein